MNLEKDLLLLAAVCFQSNRRARSRGEYTLPHGFREVALLSSSIYHLAGFIIESPKKIIVAFRGTEEPLDVITDLDWTQVPYPFVRNSGMTDRGFTQFYRSIRVKVIKELKKLSSSKKLYITGHSLGGAIATLAALDIVANTHFRQPNVYTFASPRVGNPPFVNAYNHLINHSIRVVNSNDIIPHFPPPNIPIRNIMYRHVSEPYIIHFQTFDVVRNHQVAFYFSRLCDMFHHLCMKICNKNPGLCPASNFQIP